MKSTKIVVTIGPSSASFKKIKCLIASGMNVARVNFSHGDHLSNGEIIQNLKKARKELKIPLAIMADLQGPRIRTVVKEDISIEENELIVVWDATSSRPQTEKQDSKIQNFVGLDWKGVLKDIQIGNEILIEDGLLRVIPLRKEKNYLVAKVKDGGIVKNHKGVNIPKAFLQMPILTKKDEKDLLFALDQDVDFIALSFVSNADDVKKVREKIKKYLKRTEKLPQIISKIERKEAIENILEIIKISDAIMVARGDLGIEMDENKVVIYQKEIIARCLKMAKPVIVATQMLNSMIYNARPTRAEVGDVSNAVIDHADALMLSGETANGKFPIESVKVMKDIIKKTEESPFNFLFHGFLGDSKTSLSSSIAHLAHEALKETDAKAIVAASISGFTAKMIARHRPKSPIYVMTNNEKTQNQLNLVWGVESFVLPDCQNLEELIDKSIETLRKNRLVKPKEKFVIVAGRPGISKEHMSLIKIEEMK